MSDPRPQSPSISDPCPDHPLQVIPSPPPDHPLQVTPSRSIIVILTYRQDDILLIKLPLKLPPIRFFLSYWETDGLSTDLILINVVSTISNLHQPILYKTTYRRESSLTKAILTFITWQPAIAQKEEAGNECNHHHEHVTTLPTRHLCMGNTLYK